LDERRAVMFACAAANPGGILAFGLPSFPVCFPPSGPFPDGPFPDPEP